MLISKKGREIIPELLRMPRGDRLRYLSIVIILFFLIGIISTNTTFSQPAPGRGTWATYTPKDQMIAQWKALCDAHPDNSSYESIGKTIQGRDILLFKIGNPLGAKVMYDGQAHGPEDGGTETLYKFCTWLLESNESLANHILENNYHLIIPILNMDTNARQNMRREYVLDNGTTIEVPYGVDLNRNSLYNWGHSGSSNPEDDYSYRGLYAGSEPETIAYHNAAAKYLPYIYVNTHTGAETIIAYSNTAFEQEIRSLIAQYRQQYTVDYAYPLSFSRGGSGSIAADPDNNFGASGWLWEISTWENLKPTLDEWLNEYYPRVFPVFLAFANAAENKQNNPNPTPASSPSPKSTPTPTPTQYLIHDIAVTNITYTLTSTNQSKILSVKVEVSNHGNYEETFNLKLYANQTLIKTKTVTLKARNIVTLDFRLEPFTTLGRYTLKAYAEPVPNENNETNNLFELASNPYVIQPETHEGQREKDSDSPNQNLLPIIVALLLIIMTTSLLYLNKKRRSAQIKSTLNNTLSGHILTLEYPLRAKKENTTRRQRF
jgi:hypothetical protein